MLRTNWIQGSTTWRKGAYQPIRKATGMEATKPRLKPTITRNRLWPMWVSRVPSWILLIRLSTTSGGVANTTPPFSVWEMTTHKSSAAASEMTIQTPLGMDATNLEKPVFFFELNIAVFLPPFAKIARRGASFSILRLPSNAPGAKYEIFSYQIRAAGGRKKAGGAGSLPCSAGLCAVFFRIFPVRRRGRCADGSGRPAPRSQGWKDSGRCPRPVPRLVPRRPSPARPSVHRRLRG